MSTVIASGTVLTDGTEQTLHSNAAPAAGSYALFFSAANIQSGDAVAAKMKRAILVGGAAETVHSGTITGPVPADAGVMSLVLPVAAGQALAVTFQRVEGSDRNYAWSLEKL